MHVLGKRLEAPESEASSLQRQSRSDVVVELELSGDRWPPLTIGRSTVIAGLYALVRLAREGLR